MGVADTGSGTRCDYKNRECPRIDRNLSSFVHFELQQQSVYVYYRPVNTFNPAGIIRHWGALFPYASTPERVEQKCLSWEPAELMFKAALADAQRIEVSLRDLIELSNKVLAPLADPLFMDLGLHRWLRADREEAYSDWLQWVLQQLPPEMVLSCLSIDKPDLLHYSRGQRVNIRREVLIPHGRLDLLIEIGEGALLLIEVKRMASAEAADTDKHKGYREWFDKQHQAYKPTPQLLVVSAGDDDYKGFAPLLWSKLCINLRRVLPEICRLIGPAKAALLVAFVGAVETNLLRLSTPFDSNPRPLVFGRTIDHLQQALNTKE